MTKDFLKQCETGDSKSLSEMIHSNDRTTNYSGAMIAAKHDNLELYKYFNAHQSSTLWAANSQKNIEGLPDTNECLIWSKKEIKSYERKEAIRSGFENFKIMGGIAVGLVALATIDISKVSAGLITNAVSNTRLLLTEKRIKPYECKEAIRNGFENFKIMGGMAVGLVALATIDIIKVSGELITNALDKAETLTVIHRLRNKSKTSSLDNSFKHK